LLPLAREVVVICAHTHDFRNDASYLVDLAPMAVPLAESVR
jgi:hypothetical protein